MRLFLLLATIASATLVSVGQQPSTTTSANTSTQTTTRTSERPAQNCPEVEPLRRNVAQLNGEVSRLKRRVADLEKERLPFAIQEQLEKEEQRGQALQLHLFEISEKEAPLGTRMDQINQQLSPEAIERNMAGVGSVHPENA